LRFLVDLNPAKSGLHPTRKTPNMHFAKLDARDMALRKYRMDSQ